MKVLTLILLFLSQAALADLAVIAHKNFTTDTLELQQIRSIYSGDSQYVNDIRIIPLDQLVNSENYSNFYSTVMTKPMAQIISHWSKLIFTGKGQAPMSLGGDQSIIKFVKDNPSAIGYVDVASITDQNQIKVLQTIKISAYKQLNIDALKNR